MTGKQWAKRWARIAAIVIFSLLAADVFIARAASAEPSYNVSDGNRSAAGTATVFFAGVLADGDVSVRPILGTLREQGDVVVVNYDPDRHDAQLIVRRTHDWLMASSYRRLTLVGQSMGGNLAVDLVRYARAHSSPLRFRVILHDVPAGRSTLVMGPQTYATELLYPGPIFAPLWSRAWHLLAFLHSEDQIEPQVDRQDVYAAESVMLSWPMSSYAGQVRYLGRFKPPKPGSLADVPAVIMTSTGKGHHAPNSDDVVKWTAADVWAGVFGLNPRDRIWVTSAHVDCVASPEACNQAYAAAFGRLGAW